MTTGHELAMGLRAAYLSMHRQTNACLNRHGATAEQFVVLALLAEEDGITQRELCARASSDPNTIRAILVLLQQRNWIERMPHPTDGRAHSVILTRQGGRIHNTLSKELKPLQDLIVGVFSAREARSLLGSLNRLADSMPPLNNSKGDKT